MTTPHCLLAIKSFLKLHLRQNFVKVSPCSLGSSFSSVSLGHLFQSGFCPFFSPTEPSCKELQNFPTAKRISWKVLFRNNLLFQSLWSTVWTAFDHTAQPLSVSSAGFNPSVWLLGGENHRNLPWVSSPVYTQSLRKFIHHQGCKHYLCQWLSVPYILEVILCSPVPLTQLPTSQAQMDVWWAFLASHSNKPPHTSPSLLVTAS